MARKTQIILTDDVDGTEATGTVTFTFDGVSYEIDLNDENAQRLRDDVAPWVEHARRVAGRARRGTALASSGGETKKIREWAQSNGYSVSDRGRISEDVRQAYAAAH